MAQLYYHTILATNHGRCHYCPCCYPCKGLHDSHTVEAGSEGPESLANVLANFSAQGNLHLKGLTSPPRSWEQYLLGRTQGTDGTLATRVFGKHQKKSWKGVRMGLEEANT